MIKLMRYTIVTAAFTLMAAAQPVKSAPADLIGRWEVERRYDANPHTVRYDRLVVQSERGDYVASMGRWQFEGSQDGNSLHLSCTSPPGQHGEPCGEVTVRKTDDGIEGLGVMYGNRISLTGSRPMVPPESPKLHTYEPSIFHLQFSDAVPPALRVFPGDTVRTKTLDAAGLDLGTSIEYDIAEIVSPHTNVVAKIRKDLLRQIPAVAGRNPAAAVH